MDYLSRRVDELERGRTELLTRLDNMSVYIRTLIAIMTEKEIAVPPPPWEDSRIMLVPVQPRNLAHMTQLIAKHYDDEELADLAAQIDINIEDVKGDTHKARAKALVDTADRYGSYDDLVAAAKAGRQRAKWD